MCHLDFDGIPYIVLGSRTYDCQYGVDRNLNHKRRYKKTRMKGGKIIKRHYHRVPGTKKQNCPAQIYIREVVKFPNFRITSNTEYYRRKASSQVQNAMKDGNAFGERRTYVHFPSMADHKYHCVEQVQGLKRPIDSRVKKKIHDLVAEGITDYKVLKTNLQQYIQTELFAGQDLPSRSSRRFFPPKSEIENCINLAAMKLRISQADQENVSVKINEWQQSQPEDRFYFRPFTDVKEEASYHPPVYGQQLLVVHQTKWQCQLLEWYGQDICILDGVYRSIENSLPLFFLVVKTDVDYEVAGSFIVQSETVAAVKEALGVLREWNPKWKPSVFMSDFSRVEMVAVEQTFDNVKVLLCDYQREQAWERWALNADNGVYPVKEEVLSQLRAIAHASSFQEYSVAEKHLYDSDIWMKNQKLQKWFGKMWLPEHQRWVWAYRKDYITDINTYNGIEQLNETLKYYYLKSQHQHVLSGLLAIVVEYFVPHLYTKYLQENAEEDIDTNIPEEAPVYEQPEENFALKCREVIDHIHSYTYLLNDQLILQELYESLLITYDTVLDYAEGKREPTVRQLDDQLQANQVIKVTKRSSLKEKKKKILKVPVDDKACIIPETFEVLAPDEENNKLGNFVVESEWSQPQTETVETCITYETILEDTDCEREITLEEKEGTFEVKPIQIIKNSNFIQSKEIEKNIVNCVGGKTCVMPGIFQVLVPVEANNKTGDVEEKNSVVPETYQVLVPVREKNKLGDLVVAPDWTPSQSDVASYVTISDTRGKKRKREGKFLSVSPEKSTKPIFKVNKSGKNHPESEEDGKERVLACISTTHGLNVFLFFVQENM
ncbi:Calcium-responsive transcription factor-like 1, partial [Homarus americanus]